MSSSIALSPSPSVPPARSVLREATRDLHAKAEETAAMRALFAGRLGPAGYVALLRALHAYFTAWETAHVHTLQQAALRGWAWTSRAALLAQDLGHASTVRGDRRHICAAASPAAGWGALYVIEGSTLGARILATKLRRAFPGSTALRYFSLGDGEPQRWCRFEGLLERALADPATHPDAIAGARATFTGFTAALSRVSMDAPA